MGRIGSHVTRGREILSIPGVVSIPHGWGHRLPGTSMSIASEHAGVNTNIQTDEGEVDPLSGNAVLNGIPVTMGRAVVI